MTSEEIEELIRTGLPGARVRVTSDDDVHFSAVVVTDSFTGKRAVARHQMVYACLGDRIGGEIHALTLETRAPDEPASS